MKRILSMLLFVSGFIPFTYILGIGGFGFQGGQSLLSIESYKSTEGVAELNRSEFSNPLSGGAYVYIDAIPFVDLEADFSISYKNYIFDFSNSIAEPDGVLTRSIGPYDFGWGDFSIYLTARKKIVGLGIPLLAKAKLFYGGGYNMHTVTPLINLDLMESALEGNEGNEVNIEEADPTNLSEGDLIKFLKDNQVKSNGFHIQSGFQFKVLVLDTFLFYRHTFAKDIVPGQDHFGSLNLRIGYGL